jgi:uncharacterized protein YkwD
MRRKRPGHRRAPVACAIALTLLCAGPSVAARHRDAPAGGNGHDRLEQATIDQINVRRAGRGLAALRPDQALAGTAAHHSGDMLRHGYLGHDEPGGPSSDTRLRRGSGRRYGRLSEAVGYLSPPPGAGFDYAATMVQMWMDSPPHRAILLDPRLTRIGVGRANGRFQGRPSILFTADFYGER